MIFKDIPVGDVFAFHDEPNAYLKIGERDYVHLLYRSEFMNSSEATMQRECTVLTLELLCVILHREEVIAWLHNTKAFYLPDTEKPDGETEARLDGSESGVSAE